MLFVGRPLLKWCADHFGRTADMSLILIIVFYPVGPATSPVFTLCRRIPGWSLSPHADKFVKQFASVLEPFVLTVLLPLFFSYTGIRTDIGLLSPSLWLWTLVIIAVAVAGRWAADFAEPLSWD